ncbi:MAG: ABC transporter permease subunit [Deltaproteobacteria bacterium]|nr:ABC transporter permease subunit [Deltaproteobacteria bacterium]
MVFEIVPILYMIRGSMLDKNTNALTLQHYMSLNHPLYINSFVNSITISGLTAVIGVVFGTFIGYAVYRWPSRRVQETLITLSDVTTNFAGAPLAFAFVVILGMNGVITQFVLQYFDYKLYPDFSIYSFSGLTLAYVYFQLPLMVLLILPAFAGIKKEWRESAQSLGANNLQFWRYIGVPVLTPSLIAGLTLLFANAFGAYATAYTLVQAKLSLVTLQIGYMIAGEVRKDPAIGMAMAVVSLVIMALSIAIYQAATTRARRWSKS